MTNKKAPINQIEGMNIYAGKRGQILYYNLFDKKAYQITQDRLTKFKLLNNKIIYGIMSIIIANVMLSLNFAISILIGIIVYAVVEWRFQVFLKQCTVYPKLDTSQAPRYHASENTMRIMTIKAALYLIIPVLMILNTFSPQLRGNHVIAGGSYAVSVFSFAMGIRYIEIIIYRLRHHD